MEALPLTIKTLKRIKEKLDALMSDGGTPVEIRAIDLYECISKDNQLKALFPDSRTFSRFLRKQHDAGILKQLIPNYRVDTSIFHHYQWYFYRDVNKNSEKGKQIITLDSGLKYYSRNSKIIFDGKKFRSEQEKQIYKQLMKCDYLTIEYERPVTKNGETRYVDFKILNQINRKWYYWEHFGMTNFSGYLDSMAEKIKWYKNNGFRIVEEQGNLIFTIYSNEKKFQRDIDNYVNLITNSSA